MNIRKLGVRFVSWDGGALGCMNSVDRCYRCRSKTSKMCARGQCGRTHHCPRSLIFFRGTLADFWTRYKLVAELEVAQDWTDDSLFATLVSTIAQATCAAGYQMKVMSGNSLRHMSRIKSSTSVPVLAPKCNTHSTFFSFVRFLGDSRFCVCARTACRPAYAT